MKRNNKVLTQPQKEKNHHSNLWDNQEIQKLKSLKRQEIKELKELEKEDEENETGLFNFLYVNAQFFYASEVDAQFKDWIKKLSPRSQNRLMDASNFLVSNKVPGNMYAIDNLKTALREAVVYKNKEPLMECVKNSRILYDKLWDIFSSKTIHDCMMTWFEDHADFDDRAKRWDEIKDISSLRKRS